MNKRGQSIGLTLISVIFFWIIGFSSINFIMSDITDASSQLSCDSASTITAGTMFLCLMLDTTVIYFIVTILSVVLGAITARLLV